MPDTTRVFTTLFVFLGDSAVEQPHADLKAVLPTVARGLGWRVCDEAEGGRIWRLGAPARWVTLSDSALDAATPQGDIAPFELAEAISARWPVAVVRRNADMLALALCRDGDVVDCYANKSLESEEAKSGLRAADCEEKVGRGGDPSRWADLLGTPRNAMRLETVWGSWSDADEVLSRTAAIIGWDFTSAPDAPGSSTLTLRRS